MTASKPTMGSVAGQISGIMSGVFADADSALKLGPSTSLNAEQERDFYRYALQRILEKSTRAENVWREYMDTI
jgi:hypothetical protein